VKRLSPPAFDVGRVLAACTSRVADAGLRDRLAKAAILIADDSSAFELAATSVMTHTVAAGRLPSEVTATEMIALYTQRLASPKGSARHFYDQLRSCSPFGICPLCDCRDASTLDHYLPKSIYPILAITPSNLVPACKDCNKAKLDQVPRTASDLTLHPYFDDYDDKVWLVASIMMNPEAVTTFSVSPPTSWSKLEAQRATKHFEVFGLARLYSLYAAVELSQKRHQFGRILESGSSYALREHLSECALSARIARKNSWQALTYAAWASSPGFCAGGFQPI
jgi:hypothetical protein